MSRNGSGVYSLVAGNPVVSGTTITTTWANSTLTDIASALTGSVAADGQTPMSGSLNMANNKVISVTDPTSAQDAATKAYVDLVAGGTKDGSFVNLAYTGTLTGGTGVVNLGSGQFYKDASGNVGIGTSSPANKLHIKSNDNTQATIVGSIYSNNGTAALTLGFDRINGTNSTPANASLDLGVSSVPQAMRINSSGNVGIGTSSPLLPLVISNAGASGLEVSTTYIGGGAGTYIQSYNRSGATYVPYGMVASYITFNPGNSAAEAGRFDSSGNLLVGTTTQGSVNATSFGYSPNATGGADFSHINGTASGVMYCRFNYNGTNIGSITQNGTTAVLYNTTSDYRLKNDVKPIENALTTIEALNPVSFTWIDGRKDDGFIAHELQSVIPNCVTGEKDAVEIVDDVDDEGKVIGTKEIPKYQQMDNSGVIPFLVKAIQEQQAMIEELKTKVLALEAK
jgi:hypothetical protein